MDNFTTFFSNTKDVFTWISIAIGLPSTLLYCAEIWTILRHKPFHNSFYTLFCVRASTDLVYTFSSYFFIRFPCLFPEWFMNLALPNWPCSFFVFINGYTFVSDNLAMAFILVNRFTAIARPFTHKKIWRKFMAPVLLVVYGVPMYNIGLFWINVELISERNGPVQNIHYTQLDNGTTLNTYIVITTICSILFLAFSIPINVAILWAYRKRGEPPPPQTTVGIGTAIQQQTNATAKAKSDLIERRLLLFAVITFFGHVLIACLMLAVTLAVATGNLFLMTLMNSQYSLVLDIGLVVLPAWLLLWASPSFRRQFAADFVPNIFCKKIFATPHTNTIKPLNAVVAVAKPQMQISSIPNMNN